MDMDSTSSLMCDGLLVIMGAMRESVKTPLWFTAPVSMVVLDGSKYKGNKHVGWGRDTLSQGKLHSLQGQVQIKKAGTLVQK